MKETHALVLRRGELQRAIAAVGARARSLEEAIAEAQPPTEGAWPLEAWRRWRSVAWITGAVVRVGLVALAVGLVLRACGREPPMRMEIAAVVLNPPDSAESDDDHTRWPDVDVGVTCTVLVEGYLAPRSCHVRVSCGPQGRVLYDGQPRCTEDEDELLGIEDVRPTEEGGSPKLRISEEWGSVNISDSDGHGHVSSFAELVLR